MPRAAHPGGTGPRIRNGSFPRDPMTPLSWKPVQAAVRGPPGGGRPLELRSQPPLHHRPAPPPPRAQGGQMWSEGMTPSPQRCLPPLQTPPATPPRAQAAPPFRASVSPCWAPLPLNLRSPLPQPPPPTPHPWPSQPGSLVRRPQTTYQTTNKRLPGQTRSGQGPKALPVYAAPLRDPATPAPITLKGSPLPFHRCTN